MKTIKTLLKELLKPPSKKEVKNEKNIEDIPHTEEAPESIDESNDGKSAENPDKEKIEEKETERIDINPKTIKEDETETFENVRDLRLDIATATESGEPIQESTRAGELRAAYERGLRDGRNMQIEMRYFPKDDGVPHFHGAPNLPNPGEDIFSIAREA